MLLVDDEPLFRDSTAELLRALGFDCTDVSGPNEALAALERDDYDLLVSDLVMDGEPQLAFLEQVTLATRAPAIILVTAHPSVESAVAAVDLGLVAYLPKPFETEALVRRVDEAIERRRVANLLTGSGSSLRDASEALRALAKRAEAPEAQEGDALFDTELARQLQSLTPRERDIVQELLAGYRISTIARRLEISAHTVRRHLKSIFLKLEVGSQAELLEKLKP